MLRKNYTVYNKEDEVLDMQMFAQFEPECMIKGIEVAKANGRELNANELILLKTKLLDAEQNSNIIRLARGEGRSGILDDIIENDEIIFDWGLKSQHAFHKQSEFRDFLEPNSMDVTQMKRIVNMFKEDISCRYKRNFKNVPYCLNNVDDVVRELFNIIDNNSDSHSSLMIIKDWICTVLHTAGASDFKNISPWVSATAGNQRYKTAYFFGTGHIPFSRRTTDMNKRFVIFDTWVNRYEEHNTYEKTKYLIDKFREIGLPWYPDKHHEIMLKYAIYPHCLIGYYYFENDNLLYYQVNPHYLKYMKAYTDFQIGDDIYIDQLRISFPANNPYRKISYDTH